MNLSHLFDATFAALASEPALEFGAARYTFSEVEARASRMAGVLRDRGLVRGDRLAVYLANCAEYIDLYLAATRLGVIFVPVNILYREREIAHILTDSAPRAVVTAPGAEIPAGADPWNVEALAREAVASRPADAREPLEGDDPAMIVYTSGTTGVAKGAILTHNNLLANAANLITTWRITASDRLLLPLPLFHVHGLGNGLHCWLAAGCRLRLLERFEHQSIAGHFESFRPTVFFGVPAMYVRLLDLPEASASAIGAGMRLFVSGSAPLPAQIHEEFAARFGHVILERYGMTETLMNIGNPYAGERRPGSVGFPFPGISVRNLDPNGEPVKDGETGELYVKGPNLFAGYWGREEATRAAFREGYFRTGDLAVRSSDGYYTLQGRRSDLIISGGFNIYPREIEEFLCEQPGVREAAVAGVPDRVRGEVPVAYVVPGEGFDAAALEGACRRSLASFKVPRAFLPVDVLPRTALGKVQKHLLPKWEP